MEQQFTKQQRRKKNRHQVIWIAVILCVFVALRSGVPLYSQNPARPEFHVSRAEEPPRIDGDLNDEVWQNDPLVLGDWVSYNPLYGEKLAQRTEVRVAYDDRNLYFAFHCFDNEPDKIRTTISRRDSVFNDDWVGLSLDSTGNGQNSYHLMVNPSGIQMDAVNTPSGGERWEADLVWDSAGKITKDGYVVEIKLPLQTIRFQGGHESTMGILFWRRISRSGVSSAWPDIPPGQWVFNRHAHLVFSDLKQPKLFELLPSITYGVNQTRATPQMWNKAEGKTDVGLSAKYGITSSITLDATVNPDFSQVESDAFQVVVNQRFPIFYSEKRPFFMEGMGLFNLAGTGGDGNMRTAVHTRRIVNPIWGSKLTGNAGKVTFGVLNASDESPEDIGNRGDAILGQNKFFTIGRATYGFGESNYIGGMITDTEHAGRHNRVAAGDFDFRFRKHQEFSATFMDSQTGLDGQNSTHGVGAQATYSYSTRRLTSLTQVEHYGRGFQMDSAFYNRTGFTAGWHYTEVNFYPKAAARLIKRIHPFFYTKDGRDQVQNGNDRFYLTGVRINFTRQGFLSVQPGWGTEPWMGKQYKQGGLNTFGNVQILKWLNLGGNMGSFRATYYDQVRPFQGHSHNAGLSVGLQPNQHINQSINYNHTAFSRASNGERIYTVDIVNLRTTYQFNKHFLIRAIEQFDSSQHRLLTDFLASYEIVPGSVIHGGYGSLYEKRGFENGMLVANNSGTYLTTSRGLFFKVAYLHRF